MKGMRFQIAEKHFWLFLIILCLSIFSVFLPRLYDRVEETRAVGTTYTVCASGCDYTSISAANAIVIAGDTIRVGATYNSTTEPGGAVNFTVANLTLSCASGAVIGSSTAANDYYDLIFYNGAPGATIQDCTFSNATIMASTGTVITNNIFRRDSLPTNAAMISVGGFVTGTMVTSNTFSDYFTGVGIGNFVSVQNTDGFVFASNTVNSGTVANSSVAVLGNATTSFTGNYFTFQAGTNEVGVSAMAKLGPALVNFSYNTCYYGATAETAKCLQTADGALTDYSHMAVTSSYNIFASPSTLDVSTVALNKFSPTTTFTFYEDYNDFYLVDATSTFGGTASSTLAITNGLNNLAVDPQFKIWDTNSTNNLHLAPYSRLLDINGTNDIGAYSAARGTTFTVDDDRAIDYSNVHATNTVPLTSLLRTGDTVNLSTGTFYAFSLTTSTLLAGSVTIDGLGALTIVDGTYDTSIPSISLTGLNTSTIRDLTVQNGTSASAPYRAGIKIESGDANVIENVTSTGNDYGVWFKGTAYNNVVSSTVLVSSVLYDVFDQSSANNLFKNVSFTAVSSSISATGTVSVYYTTRAYVVATSSAVISGVGTILNDTSLATSAEATTTASGYTPYSDYLLAWTMSSSSVAVTNGGYNPFTLRTTALGRYSATTSVATNLTTSGQTYSVVIYAAGAMVTESSGSTIVTEGGSTDTYTVALESKPIANVTVTLSYSGSDISLSASTLTFTSSSWNTPQTVTVTAVNDDFVENTEYVTITQALTSSDGLYNGFTTTTVAVSVISEDVESGNTGGGGGGGGGFSTAPTLPTSGAVVINKGSATTDDRKVEIAFSATNVKDVAISNSSNFSGVSYQPYTVTTTWTLTSGYGQKTVYVKFRSSSGGVATANDSIEYVAQSTTEENTGEPEEATEDQTTEAEECPLAVKKAYKHSWSPAVYYVTNDCTKRPFNSAVMYFSYFSSWDDVETVTKAVIESVPDDALGFMPWGPNYDPKYGALVKIVKDPKVYLLLNMERYWINSESVFKALKYSWDWIEDISEELLAKYTVGEEINYTDHHPNYTLVKYPDSVKVYRLEPDAQDTSKQVKRWIPDEKTFNSLNFRWDRIVVIDANEVYETGTDLVL